MPTEERSGEEYMNVADVEIDAVRPEPTGFVLTGRGQDGADYQLQMDLEMPIDRRTRQVLGELLAQSEWHIRRRAKHPFGNRPALTRRRSAT